MSLPASPQLSISDGELMRMAQVDREHSRPALMCICSERQWLLWRTIFENREIVDLVNEHFLFWVQSSGGTAGKQALTALKDESNTGTVAVICNVGDRERVLLKMSGPPTVAELKGALEEALKEFREHKKNWLRLEEERELKRQQDLDYQESLLNDREKERRKRNTKACQTIVEETAEPHPEPEDGTMPPPPKRLRSNEMTRLIIILPCGGRQHLDVSKESTLKAFYQQVRNQLPEGSPDITLSYQVDGSIWRQVPDHETMTVAQFQLEPNSVLRSAFADQAGDSDP